MQICAQVEHFGVHLGLQTRLHAGAEDAEDAVAAAEFARHHGGDGGGADVGEMAGIGQQRDGLAGLGGGEQHHAVAGRAVPRARLPGNVPAIFSAKYLPPRR